MRLHNKESDPVKKAKNLASLPGTPALSEKMDRPLTDMQRAFIKEWASGESIKSAAMRAGYRDGGLTAKLMVRNPRFLQYYHKEKALYEQISMMTRKRVMDGLLEGIEMAKLVSEPASMISGWREVGKMCGYYEPVKRQLDINIQGNVTVKRLEAMSDTDLLKLIKGDVEDVMFEEMVAEDEDENDT